MPKLSNNVALYEAALNSVNPPFASSWQLGDMEGWGAKALRGVAGRAFKMRRKPAFGSVVGIAHAIGKGGYARRRRSALGARSRGFASAFQRSGMHGLGDFWSDLGNTAKSIGGKAVSGVTAGLQEKGQKLENALKIIMALSGVAALTGVVNLVRR